MPSSHAGAIVLITDRVYIKTLRHIKKIRVATRKIPSLSLAIVDGFPSGLDPRPLAGLVDDVLHGTIEELRDQLRIKYPRRRVFVVALNQSAILPGIALQRAMGLDFRRGYIESCDKRLTRQLLASHHPHLALAYAHAIPGKTGSTTSFFDADAYIVKPAFGMSSSDVRKFDRWCEAKEYAESTANSADWVPSHVMRWLSRLDIETNVRLIEPYIDGVEFSVDGWIHGKSVHTIVQHKLWMVRSTFIGDGPTVSPPLDSAPMDGWLPLKASEADIEKFACEVLEALGFHQGVFHIEGREERNGRLRVIEVNPRAPGGSLWKSALLRTGYDLELVDASIQLGRGIPKRSAAVGSHVFHYPYYANRPGVLRDWGELDGPTAATIDNLEFDFVCQIGTEFSGDDLLEEPYLAFAVAHGTSSPQLLDTLKAVLRLLPPRIESA